MQRHAAITSGDVHAEKGDALVFATSRGEHSSSILNSLKPQVQYVHDLADFAARNNHNIDSAQWRAERYWSQIHSVEANMATAAAVLTSMLRPWCMTVVVESNHDQAFARWLDEADGHHDEVNAHYYHRWNAEVFAAKQRGENLDAFEAAIREKADSSCGRMLFLREDHSHQVRTASGVIECGAHGHRGVNGVRGSAPGFRRLGTRITISHGHSPYLDKGVMMVSVSGSLCMGYNVGPSSWAHAHGICYQGGKRALIFVQGGRWRAKPLAGTAAARDAWLNRIKPCWTTTVAQ